MSGLISGTKAKLAWANGEQLQVAHITENEWRDLNDNYALSVFTNDKYVFRLKPLTITINGIEVPAPFAPKDDDRFYYLTDDHTTGYTIAEKSEFYGEVKLGAWRTEDEIKQVVAALRQVFGKV